MRNVHNFWNGILVFYLVQRVRDKIDIHFNKIPHILSDFTFQCIDQIAMGTPQDRQRY